jgi:hypothetical protein
MDKKRTASLFVRAERGGRRPGIGSDLLVGMKNTLYIFQNAGMAELVPSSGTN